MRKRIDARIKPWLREGLEKIAELEDETITHILDEVIEYGLNWKEKQIKKTRDKDFTWKPSKWQPMKKETNPGESVPYHNNNSKQNETDDNDEMSEEEMKKILDSIKKK